MSRYFGRVCQLLLSPDGISPPIPVVNDQPGSGTGNVAGIRIQFSVQKILGPTSNRAHIRVWNLNPNLRRSMANKLPDFQTQPRPAVFLSAGYQDNVGLICRGTVLRCVNRHEPPDWITDLDVLTDWQQTTNALAELSFLLGASPLLMTAGLVTLLGWGAPNFSADALLILAAAPPVARTFTGRAADRLTELLDSFGLTWTVDDGAPWVFRSRGAIDPEALPANLPVLSQATGVVGTPEVTDTGVEIRTLLNPALRLGRRFLVSSPTIVESLGGLARTQEYVANQVRHEGDTWDNQWTTWIEGGYYPYLQLLTEDPAQVLPFSTAGGGG